MRTKLSPAQRYAYKHVQLKRVLIKLQSQFYRTFTRPIAKTLLIAVFVYQLAYWSWVKLETDEIRAERDGWS